MRSNSGFFQKSWDAGKCVEFGVIFEIFFDSVELRCAKVDGCDVKFEEGGLMKTFLRLGKVSIDFKFKLL